MTKDIENKIFRLTKEDFTGLALDIFRLQYQHNKLYWAYSDSLGIDPVTVDAIQKIPFLPIGFFKTHSVQTGLFDPEIIFESSGTTQTMPSTHRVKDLSLYKESFMLGFERRYGVVKDQVIIGLLPSYLERTGSSLVMMVDTLIRQSAHRDSGFYLYDFESLADLLKRLEQEGQKAILIGVSFALLDFAEQFPQLLKHTIVIETGGMKGKREEITRPELHAHLKKGFGVESVHSEYGMTELLSQGYSAGDGIFESPPWMRILVRDEDDPLDVREEGIGPVNIIDLANIHSCSFIATEDLGRVLADGSFEIMGRMDNSDLRGCSLLVV
jgi:hypothetical protein